MPELAPWTPARLRPYAWYDAHVAGSASGIFDSSANRHPAMTVGAGSNAPLWLPYTAPVVHLSNPSRTNTSSSATFDVVDFDGWVDLSFSTLTPTAATAILQRVGSDPNRQFNFKITTSGKLGFDWYPLGTTASIISVVETNTLAADTGVTAGQRIAVRATLDVDDGAGHYVAKLWYRLGGYNNTWTLIETFTGGATTVLPTPVNRVLEVGHAGGANTADLMLYGAALRSGIDGADVARFDPSLFTQSGGTDTAGNVWSFARPTTGRKLVIQSPSAGSAESLFLLGADDYLTVPAPALPPLDTYAAPSTVVVVERHWHNPGTLGHAIFTTKVSLANTNLGYAIRLNTTAATTPIVNAAGDGTNSDGHPNTAAQTFGLRNVLIGSVGNVSPFASIQCNLNGVGADTVRDTTISTSTGLAGRVGAYTAGSAYIDMEFRALLTFNRRLSAAEIAQLVAYYKGGV